MIISVLYNGYSVQAMWHVSAVGIARIAGVLTPHCSSFCPLHGIATAREWLGFFSSSAHSLIYSQLLMLHAGIF